MRLRNIALTGIVMLVLAFTTIASATDQNNTTGNDTQYLNITGTPTETFTAPIENGDDEEVDEGLIGPGNALYGLKIAFENIGEVFTFNASEKLGKQVSNARHRINEARAALRRNDTEAANKALAEYKLKVDDVNESVSKLSDKDTGVANARKMILKHQFILENLSISHPGNKGLQRAYNNSKELQVKIESRIDRKSDSNIMQENQEKNKAERSGPAVKEEKPEREMRNEKRVEKTN